MCLKITNLICIEFYLSHISKSLLSEKQETEREKEKEKVARIEVKREIDRGCREQTDGEKQGAIRAAEGNRVSTSPVALANFFGISRGENWLPFVGRERIFEGQIERERERERVFQDES